MPFWILLFTMTTAAFFALCVLVLPRLILKNGYKESVICDRGLKKFRLDGGGVAITYEPGNEIRRYIDQYALSVKDGVKSITYRVAVGIKLIDIDILLYDSDGVAFLTLNSKNILDGNGHIQTVELPMRAAYASVSVNQVDAQVIRQDRALTVSPIRLGIYFAIALALCVGYAFVTRLCFGNILGGAFREDYLASPEQGAAVFVAALIFGVISCGASLAVILLRGRKR